MLCCGERALGNKGSAAAGPMQQNYVFVKRDDAKITGAAKIEQGWPDGDHAIYKHAVMVLQGNVQL